MKRGQARTLCDGIKVCIMGNKSTAVSVNLDKVVEASIFSYLTYESGTTPNECRYTLPEKCQGLEDDINSVNSGLQAYSGETP